MDVLMELWDAHNIWLIPLVWLILSCVLNVALRKKTAEEWVKFAERSPRAAAVVRLIRALGLDPSKAILAIKHLVNGKAVATRRVLPPEAGKALEAAETLAVLKDKKE